MTTAKVVEEFVKFYTENTEEVKINEMKKKLSEIYKKVSEEIVSDDEDKKVKKVKKEKVDKEVKEKKKREPTAYNLFLKSKMTELKDNGMTVREKMTECGRLWKIEKENVEEKEVETEIVKEEKVVEIEEEKEVEIEEEKVVEGKKKGKGRK